MSAPVLQDITAAELFQGALIGVMRHAKNLSAGKVSSWAFTEQDQDWQNFIIGAIGELVVAKALGAFWSGGIRDGVPNDVGLWEVRAVKSRDGRLILKPADPDNRRFALVRPVAPLQYEIVGWIYGYEGKRDEFLFAPNNRAPAFFVPDEALQDFRPFLIDEGRDG